MQRNTRTNRNVAKPFVSGGVISNFTGNTPIVPAPVAAKPTNNIQIPIAEVKQPAVVPMVQSVPAPHIEHLIKTEPVSTEGANGATDANGAPKKRWNRQPINKKIKRIRRNRRLRKMLIPKNALMSLNELMGSTLSDFNFTPEERGFVTHFYVNNIQYEGRGTSKTAAKNNASEKALRDIIIQKMVQAPKAVPKVNGTGTTDDDPFNEDVEMQEGDDDETTEVPMMHLASFALHKLFSEWQAEGFEIPDFKNLPPPAAGTAAQADEKMAQQPLAAPRAEVPDKAEAMHPTTLLCMMRPSVKYVDLGSEGTTPNIAHRIGVEVDGVQFFGNGKSKKIARKNAAAAACTKLFNVQFVNTE